jgi:hypothetical protein
MFHPEQEFQIFYLSGAITPLDGVFLMYMQNKRKIKIILIFIAVLLILFGIFTVFIHPTLKGTPQEGNQSQNTLLTEKGFTDTLSSSSLPTVLPSRSSSERVSVAPSTINTKSIPGMDTITNENIQKDFVNLIAGDKNINLQITQGQTLYEILQNGENKKLISFDGKEYTGIGFFMTSIGNLHQENAKYLMYYVNGIEASLGISQYVPKSGDLIEWKLK